MVQKSILLIIFILIPAILFCQETTPLPEVTTSIEEPTPFQEETDALEDGPTPVPEEKAEDMPALPEDKEAEEAIFDFTIGDAEVDFFLTGSWTFTFFAATGILITPEGGVQYLDSFPSFTDGFYFKQIPDLTLSVWILEKYFIDITYRGEEEKENLFLAGYEGGEDELLRHLYIGNTDINLSPSPYLEIPESGNSSLGTHALLNTPASTHELLLRYDYNTDGKKIYKGKNEVVEIRYSPEEYIRGYYFKLPDADIENTEIYIQDPLGSITDQDGRKFRKADTTDVILDASPGTLLLKNEYNGRILIYYTKNGNPVGDPANGTGALVGEDMNYDIDVDAAPIDYSFSLLEHLGQDMTPGQVTLSNGRTCLLLYEPGLFSSFEINSTYEVADGFPDGQWMVETSIVRKGTYTEFTLTRQVLVKCDKDNNRLIVYSDDDLRNNFRNLYSFIDTSPDIYGPKRPVSEISSTYEILLELLFPVAEYYLDPDVIPGSVRVIRNGIEEKRFTVNYESGTIAFQIEILPTDRLEIFYKRKFESYDNGDIIFGWKNRIDINDTSYFEASTGLKWNAIPGTYSEKAYSKTGSIMGLCSYQTSLDKFKLAISGVASFTNPDTTGIFRLFGMEESGLDVIFSEDTAWPCSIPAAHGATTFPSLERGKLLYKNYREYGFLGDSTLKPITWDIPEDQVFSYETGQKTGPYSVTDSQYSSTGSSLVMDFVIPADKSWTGIQIPLVQDNATVDLSHITSLSLSFKALDITDPVTMYIQMGEIGEDIDNDNLLDEEPSATSTGFFFYDESNEVTLLIGGGPRGTGNSRKDSEDIDGNRFLDPEVTERVVSKDSIDQPKLSIPVGDTTWETCNIFFTEAEKQKLKRTRFIRIVIATEEMTEVSGKLLIDRIFLAGEIHWQKKWLGTSITNDEELEVREIFEHFAQNKPETFLEDADPSVVSIFHPGREEQKVLEVEWDHIEQGEGWELSYAGVPQVKGIMYEKLSFYIRMPEGLTGEETITFSLKDHLDRGIRIDLPAEQIPIWKKLTVDMKTDTVSLDSEEIEANLTIDDQYTSFTSFSIALTNFEADATESLGILYIDEVHLTSPQLELGAAVLLETSVDIPGDILTYKGIPILSDFYFYEKASFVKKGFAPLYGEAAPSNLTQSLTEISLGLLFSELDMDLTIAGEDSDFTYGGGHSLKIPKDIPEVKFEDIYKLIPTESGNNFFRLDSFTLHNNDNIKIFDIKTSAYSSESILVQNWDISTTLFYKELLSFASSSSYMVSSSSFNYSNEWYIPAWIYGFQYIVPIEENKLDERTGKLSADFSINYIPVGFSFLSNINITSNNIVENNRDYSSTSDMKISIPVTIIPIKTLTLIITPSYSRSLFIKNPFDTLDNFFTDIHQWSNDLGEHTYILQYPFIEFFSAQSEETFIEVTGALETQSVTYTPTFSLTLKKESPGSNLTDLFVPSSFEFSLNKQFVKNFDLYDFYNTYTITAGFNAINLFGKFGAYSLCDLYTIDEFTTNISMNIITREEENQYAYEFVNYMSFADSKQNQLLIENHLFLNFKDYFSFIDFGSFSYQWNIIPKKHLPLPLIPKEVEEKSFYTNEESLSYSINKYNNPDTLSNITLLLGHSTFLKFPPHGYIKAGMILGFNFESIAPDFSSYEAIRIAVQAGIEAYIQW